VTSKYPDWNREKCETLQGNAVCGLSWGTLVEGEQTGGAVASLHNRTTKL